MSNFEDLTGKIEELEKMIEGTVAKAFAKLSTQKGLPNDTKKRGIRGG